MKIKLYLDEDAQRKGLIFALERHKIDVLTPNAAQTKAFSDENQLEFAASLGRTILTYNAGDFIPLHYDFLEQEKAHAGIIICQQNRFGIGEIVRRLLNLMNNKTAEEMQNQIEFLSNW